MEKSTAQKAWQIDRQIRLSAIPVDRRSHASNWEALTDFPHGDGLMEMFWLSRVPGSGAPEIPYVEMVESMANRGYDMRAAEALLPEGLRLAEQKDIPALRVLTARLLHEINSAPPIPGHIYWSYEHPATWVDVQVAMAAGDPGQDRRGLEHLEERIYQGWLGQLAGGSFGTCIEGYHTDQIEKVYGEITSYLTAPETMNDDVVYELVLLDVFARSGRNMTARELGLEWVRQIPFGWSAEWIALENLRNGLMPPFSASCRNPYSDWIGAQMRGMICGMLAPAWPVEAARLAHIDGSVSHVANGIYGEMYAALLTSLAFNHTDVHVLVEEAARYLPQKSEYAAVVRGCLDILHTHPDYRSAWKVLDPRFEEYNWIHAYPNIAADLLALWYGLGDMTESFKILAHAGVDVDCNAGLVGNVLGVMNGVPEKWSAPLGDLLETYIPGKEKLSIRTLAHHTAELARK